MSGGKTGISFDISFPTYHPKYIDMSVLLDYVRYGIEVNNKVLHCS